MFPIAVVRGAATAAPLTDATSDSTCPARLSQMDCRMSVELRAGTMRTSGALDRITVSAGALSPSYAATSRIKGAPRGRARSARPTGRRAAQDRCRAGHGGATNSNQPWLGRKHRHTVPRLVEVERCASLTTAANNPTTREGDVPG